MENNIEKLGGMTMSYVEIVGFDKDGDAFSLGRVKNAYRGAMSIWKELERRYLKPIGEPLCINGELVPLSRTNSFSGEGLQELWDLYKLDEVSLDEKITHLSTFDYVLVRRENISRLLMAFKNFSSDKNNLEEQISIIKKGLETDITAIGWNQTSVNSNRWLYHDEAYNKDLDEYGPYNCFKNDKHFWLFEKLKKEGFIE